MTGSELSTWESIFVGAAMIGVLIWIYPSVKNAIERGKDAPKDWAGVLIPIGAVVLFILFLIQMV